MPSACHLSNLEALVFLQVKKVVCELVTWYVSFLVFNLSSIFTHNIISKIFCSKGFPQAISCQVSPPGLWWMTDLEKSSSDEGNIFF